MVFCVRGRAFFGRRTRDDFVHISVSSASHFYAWTLCRAALGLVLVVLTACVGGPNYAPVSDLHSPPVRAPEHYVVRPGDTLYSIAFRYGLDFRGLAAANNIGSDYRIAPGQRLRLDDSAAVAPTATARTESTRKPASSPSSNDKTKVQKPAPIKPSTEARKSPQVADNNQLTTWQWPTEGKLIRGFSSSQYAHKGIDIAGQMEQPVKAAANGVVVYAGSGLVGYGKLLIVKHSDRYLSAYAHNNRLLVKEGDQVSQGQVIARMGDTGTDRTKLHFEIRKDGKPVSPLGLLPGRT